MFVDQRALAEHYSEATTDYTAKALPVRQKNFSCSYRAAGTMTEGTA